MLHVTNGDCAGDRLAATGLPGAILPWRDVLHEGPVSAGLSLAALSEVRAAFIAGRGWGDLDAVRADFAARDRALADFAAHDELVLWFEHDLYDQLQLIQILDWLSGQDLKTTRLSLALADDYLGRQEPDALRALYAARRPATPDDLDAATRAFAAFRAPDPRALEAVLATDLSPLPHLAAALRRQLEQFPAVGTGLSRTEAQALAALAAGARTVREAFVAAQAHDEPIFLGDTGFLDVLVRLGGGAHPLVTRDEGGRLAPADGLDARVVLTATGRDVLAGARDWIALGGADRWLGGVHLEPGVDRWRWDPSAGRLRG